MGKPTFRSFNDVVRELEDVYGHQELWLYSGLNEDCPVETARRRQEWRSPKILKRNGRMVAEQSGQPEFWGRCEQVPDMRSSYSSGAHPRGTS